MYLGQLCLSKRCSFFLIHKSYVRSIKRYCFISKYAAIPVYLLTKQYLLIIIIISSSSNASFCTSGSIIILHFFLVQCKLNYLLYPVILLH